MTDKNTVVAVYPDHSGAGAAVKKLAAPGIDVKSLTVVGKGYQTDQAVTGFYNAGDRIKFRGRNGAFRGALRGWLMTGVLVAVPPSGSVVVLGYLAATVLSVVGGAVIVGGLSALGAALYSIGIPKDSIIGDEASIEAEIFPVMAHGTPEDLARAKSVPGSFAPATMTAHPAPTAIAVI